MQREDDQRHARLEAELPPSRQVHQLPDTQLSAILRDRLNILSLEREAELQQQQIHAAQALLATQEQQYQEQQRLEAQRQEEQRQEEQRRIAERNQQDNARGAKLFDQFTGAAVRLTAEMLFAPLSHAPDKANNSQPIYHPMQLPRHSL